MYSIACILLCFNLCHAASSNLQEVARQVHDEIPHLRRKERQRRADLESSLLKNSRPYNRLLEDYGQAQYQYGSNQYNANRQNPYYGYAQEEYQMWDPYLTEEEFGFDITGYSFKYTGCHDVGRKLKSSGDASRYATFRLCPTDTCSGKSTWGCKSDYGEYIVPVDLLVMSLIEHNQARVTGYCEYCQNCAALESFNEFAAEILMHRDYILGNAKQKFSTWCSRK